MKYKRFLICAVISAALMMSACGEKPNDKNPGATDNPIVSGDTSGVTSGDNGELPEELPESQSGDAYEIVSKLLTDRGASFAGGNKSPEEDNDYGEKSSAVYEMTETDMIIVTEFESAEAAREYASHYDITGSEFTSENECMMIDYIAPVHMWRYNEFIVSYASFTGEMLAELNGLFGTEFAGAGQNYFRPDYVNELVDALFTAGYGVNTERAEELSRLYMYSPESICKITVSNGDEIFVSKYSDKYAVFDHAARFSRDGETYTGFNGQNSVTIELDYQYPLHLYSRDDTIIEYSSETAELLNVITSVYGYQFAGEPYESEYNENASGEDKSVTDYDAEYIRTDYFGGESEFPQYALIRSKDELDSYYESYKEVFDLEARDKVYADSTAGWLDEAKNYDEEWFKENDLLLVVLQEPSGSNRHEITGVTEHSDGSYSVSIRRLIPLSGTEDMAGWHLFIDLKQGKLNPLTKFEIEISEKVLEEECETR